MVLFGFEVSSLSFHVGVKDPNEVRHGRRGAFKISDPMRSLQVRVVDFLVELMRLQVVNQVFVLKNQKLVDSLLHRSIITFKC